ncbi:MAG: putative toxin-antitoxin system toxin component, PIN family [Terracidiphilus sp.]|jgi:putative PIN family toxin of toxin-antitoxin system
MAASRKQVLELALNGRAHLLVSQSLNSELARVLREKFDLTPRQITANADTLWKHAEWIVPRRRLKLCPDEPDNRVLECAMEGHADFIVTGDRDLLNLPAIEGLAILTPAAFLSRSTESEPPE